MSRGLTFNCNHCGREIDCSFDDWPNRPTDRSRIHTWLGKRVMDALIWHYLEDCPTFTQPKQPRLRLIQGGTL